MYSCVPLYIVTLVYIQCHSCKTQTLLSIIYNACTCTHNIYKHQHKQTHMQNTFLGTYIYRSIEAKLIHKTQPLHMLQMHTSCAYT